jgi:hypothetical protein
LTAGGFCVYGNVYMEMDDLGPGGGERKNNSKTRVSKDGGTLDIVYAPAFRLKPARVVLHRPPLPGLKRIRVNGKIVRLSDVTSQTIFILH